jgi:hypothetical protein
LTRLEATAGFQAGPMREKGFRVVSGQRMDTGVSGGTPVVFRGLGGVGGMTSESLDSRGGAESRFREHIS